MKNASGLFFLLFTWTCFAQTPLPPDQWEFRTWERAEGWRDADHNRAGVESLAIQGINGGWATTVSVTPGAVHTLRYHYKSASRAGKLSLFVRHKTPAGKLEALLYNSIPVIDSRTSKAFVDGVYVGGADEHGWIPFEDGRFVAPAGTKEVELLIKLRGKTEQSRVWLSDLTISEQPPRSMPDSSVLLAQTEYGAIWTENENRKVLPGTAVPAGPESEMDLIAAAGGEVESFQMVFTPNADLSGVNWSWDSFSGPEKLDADLLRCRKVELIPITQPKGPFSHKGLNPDPLTEQLPCSIPAGEHQAFWFTLRIPRDQTPGLYSGKLTLSANSKVVGRVPLQFKVRGFSLPTQSSLYVSSQFRYPLVLKQESGADDEVIKRYYRNYFDHRSSCPVAARIGVRIRDGKAEVNMDRYLSHLRFLRDELHATRLRLDCVWIGHDKNHRMLPGETWQGIRIFHDAALTTLTPEFRSAFRSYLEQVCARLKSEGLFLNPVTSITDEPNFEDPPTVNGIKTLAAFILEVEPTLQIRLACNYPHPELTGLISLWNIHTDAWDRNLHHIRHAQKAGNEISVYNNAINLPEYRPIRTRLWPWLLWKYRVDGTLSWWGTVVWRNETANPWTAGIGSSGVLLYPPRSPDEHGPIDSVRWELFREGLEDYEYLKLARDLTQNAPPALASLGRTAIAEAEALVERWPNVKSANDEPYTLDVGAIERARTGLAEAIEAMLGSQETRNLHR